MTQIHTGTLKHSHIKSSCSCRPGTHSLSGASFSECLSSCFDMSKCTKKCPAQVKGIRLHHALEVETDVWHPLPAPSALLVHTGPYSRSVLKQMTPGSSTIDHNNKNTPTASCSHLLLEHHPLSLSLSLSLSFAYTPIYLPVCL